MKLRTIIFCAILVTHFSSLVTAQQVSIKLKDTARGIIRTDSANWQEAWIEIAGASSGFDSLKLKDLVVSNGERNAEVLSIDSIGAKYKSHLALSFVLDNSGSMFHSYDSLTKYCDSLVDSLPPGARFQAVAFDNLLRDARHQPTRRENLYVAQTRFRDSATAVKAFWHYYDTIRTQYTPLYDAIAVAAQNIDSRRMLLLDTLADVLLVVTDGQDNASRTSLEALRELLNDLHIRLYAINYRTEDGRLEWLANHTDGDYFVASNLKELRTVLRDLRHIISRQYHVRYRFPSLGPSGSPRTNGR